jgi:Cu/Ag efflux protein CusF
MINRKAGAASLGFLAILLLLPSTACKRESPGQRYGIQAEVIANNPPSHTLIIKHGDIAGFMPAMTMSYAVAVPAEAANLRPGDTISAELVVSDGRTRLEHIRKLDPTNAHPPGGQSGATEPPRF